MTRETVVLADVHLTSFTPQAVIADLIQLLEDNAGKRVVFAGDLFDLSADPRHGRDATVADAFESQPALRAALGTHIERDGEAWFVGGNHDAHIGDADAHASLSDALSLEPSARGRLRTSPWFFRDEHVHFEHGHLYDPDNAPEHPLVRGARSLGVHFVEEFIAPTGAYHYLNANDETPLKLFTAAFKKYGARAPYVVYRYFHTAAAALARSGPLYPALEERTAGRDVEPAFAAEHGVAVELLQRLLEQGAPPTMRSLPSTFSRLYLDRVIATLAIAGGTAGVATGRLGAGAVSLALGTALMSASWLAGHDRYGGTVPEHLARGAERVADASGAKTVIFGHTHREADHDRYFNTGSFAFFGRAPGRPYLMIDDCSALRPRVTRRYLAAT